MQHIHHGAQNGADSPHGSDHCGGGGGAAGDVVLVVVVGGARSERAGRGENACEGAARGTELVVVAAAGRHRQRAEGLVVVAVVRWWWCCCCCCCFCWCWCWCGWLYFFVECLKRKREEETVWSGGKGFCIPFGPSSLSASLLCLMASLVVRKAHGGVWPAFGFVRKVSEVWWRRERCKCAFPRRAWL